MQECLFTLPEEVDKEGLLKQFGALWFQSFGGGPERPLDWTVFQKACERTHGIIDDQLALSTYLYLYATHVQAERKEALMSKENFRDFVKLSQFLYLLDSWNPDTVADEFDAQLEAVVSTVFNSVDGEEPKETRSVLKVVEANMPNCTQHVHKFVVYRLVRGSTIGGVFTNRLVLDPGEADTTQFKVMLSTRKLWQLAAILPVVPFFKNPIAEKSSAAPVSRRPSYYGSSGQGEAELHSNDFRFVAKWCVTCAVLPLVILKH